MEDPRKPEAGSGMGDGLSAVPEACAAVPPPPVAFVPKPGMTGTYGEFPATLLRQYDGGMWEMRMPGGVACQDIHYFVPDPVRVAEPEGCYCVESDEFGDDWPAFTSQGEAEAFIRKESQRIASEQACEGGEFGLYGPWKGVPVATIAQEIYDRNVDTIAFHPSNKPAVAPAATPTAPEAGAAGSQLVAAANWLLDTVTRELASDPRWPGNLPDATARQQLEAARHAIEAWPLAQGLLVDRARQVAGLLRDRIEDAGFLVSGPTDPRAAEDGEPTWVCVARGEVAWLEGLSNQAPEARRAAAALRTCEGIPDDLLLAMSPGIFVELRDRSFADREAARALREASLAICTNPAVAAALQALIPEASQRFLDAIAGVDGIGGAHREGPALRPTPLQEPFLEDLPDMKAQNERKAQWGQEALSFYAARTGVNLKDAPQEDVENLLADLLADLRHTAGQDGLDFEACAARGERNHELDLMEAAWGPEKPARAREISAGRLKAGVHEVKDGEAWRAVVDVEPWEDTKVLIHLAGGSRLKLDKAERIQSRRSAK